MELKCRGGRARGCGWLNGSTGALGGADQVDADVTPMMIFEEFGCAPQNLIPLGLAGS
jgi:hypothetical protein